MSDEGGPSCLILVIDTSPVWWGKKLLKQEYGRILSESLDALMVFCSAHLMLHHQNQLVVLAAHTNCSQVIFPSPNAHDAAMNGDAAFRGQSDGKYEVFAEVQSIIKDQLTDLILHDGGGEVHSDCLLAGALARALCYVNKINKGLPDGDAMRSRVLVVQGSEDNPLQYMDLMNIIFTAQKQNVIIDACIMDEDSPILQQVCDITGGFYLKTPQPSALLQYLLWVFLLEPGGAREKLNLPAKVHVDYRAACFCHRNLINTGYVCSVCLSVFCSFSPICSTCQTTFKLHGPPKLLKRKAKK
ncbi:hypothetical protein CAPTEDRAFT_169977 [Capitella teleta]|uniref:General transcription factor IIH subunit 3 n=1 Tax=Capitella teleta TaxID=283909 RepID=R7VEY6_CAPTE|nr:hypothetical protein CAPTEDRAFT_169977 [Capitella teleta]|eukprot:ELU14215.1 hypothetical protein CAPTEDRAFT_169977 [Capitella teleta]